MTDLSSLLERLRLPPPWADDGNSSYDLHIIPLVRAMWNTGFYTSGSCEGHFPPSEGRSSYPWVNCYQHIESDGRRGRLNHVLEAFSQRSPIPWYFSGKSIRPTSSAITREGLNQLQTTILPLALTFLELLPLDEHGYY